jgi:hypothetical protein
MHPLMFWQHDIANVKVTLEKSFLGLAPQVVQP